MGKIYKDKKSKGCALCKPHKHGWAPKKKPKIRSYEKETDKEIESAKSRTKKSYQEDLIESLKNPKEAAAYLNAAIEEGDRELLLLALRNIAEAQGGISAVAKKANLNREHLYRVLSKRGNPEIKSLLTLLHAMGLELSVKVQKQVYA